MYSLRLSCSSADIDTISCALWEAGTAGIREEEQGETVLLIAGFEDVSNRDQLSRQFSSYQPQWEREEDVDWEEATREAWPSRNIGQRIFLAPLWNDEPIPEGRVRVFHNPSMASGTGEHPCTQLALESIETNLRQGDLVVDAGTGSGVLALASLVLGARVAVGLDLDEIALAVARENYETNSQPLTLAAGSVDAIGDECADLVVANISATVLLDIAADLLRIVKQGGRLIVTGFPESELQALQLTFGYGPVTGINEWRCLTVAL